MDLFLLDYSILSSQKCQQLRFNLSSLQKQFQSYSQLNHFASILNPQEDDTASIQNFLKMKSYLIQLCSLCQKLCSQINDLQDNNKNFQKKIQEVRGDMFKIAQVNFILEEQNISYQKQLQQAVNKIISLQKQKQHMSLKVNQVQTTISKQKQLYQEKIKQITQNKNYIKNQPLTNQIQKYKILNQNLQKQIKQLRKQIKSITYKYQQQMLYLKKQSFQFQQSLPLHHFSSITSPETSNVCLQKQLNQLSGFINFQNHSVCNNSRLIGYQKKQKSFSQEKQDQIKKIDKILKIKSQITDLTTNYDVVSYNKNKIIKNENHQFKQNRNEKQNQQNILIYLHNYLQKKIVIDRIKGVDAHELICHKNT